MPPDPKPRRVRDREALRRFRIEHIGEPCEVCEIRPGMDPHHIIFRSQFGDDVEENLLWVCRHCHDDIHSGRLDRYAFDQ